MNTSDSESKSDGPYGMCHHCGYWCLISWLMTSVRDYIILGQHDSASDGGKSSINTGKTPSDVSGSVSTLVATSGSMEARLFRMSFIMTKATSVHRFLSLVSVLIEYIRTHDRATLSSCIEILSILMSGDIYPSYDAVCLICSSVLDRSFMKHIGP